MRPVLIEFAGLQVQSYGVSKVLAAMAAGWLLRRELVRRGRDPEHTWTLIIAAVVGGFLGAKLYYLAEQAGGGLTAHDLAGSGFTWYGGMIGGALAVVVAARRTDIPLELMAGMAAVPLAVAYGIGRLGCLLAGDGTYGGPTDLPWGMSFPEGTVPTTAVVHPTPLYEAIAVFLIAALLWSLRDRLSPIAIFGSFAVLFGLERFLVEFVRINEPVLAGLSAPQLWSLLLVGTGALLIARVRRPGVTGGTAPAGIRSG
jgi:phosphatidylglycerol---prolipoprotein diacylglyceryl transferase